MRLYDSPAFDRHDAGDGHAERPARLVAARSALAPLKLTVDPGRAATRAELLGAHGAAYVDRILSLRSRRVRLDADTALSEGSVDAALTGAGAAIEAAEGLLRGESSLVLARPPGHHATVSRAMGFCVFNNAALAASKLAAAGRRVAVFDPDVHHGNGTQDIFYRRGDVLTVSLHRYPFYPGTGGASEIGEGDGLGTTLNVPMPGGAGDAHYAAAMRHRVLPAMIRFAPDLVVIAAGYDALAGDPLGGMRLSVNGLAACWAEITARWPVMATLEGGYALPSLKAGLRATVGVLTGESRPELAHEDGAFVDIIRRWNHPLLGDQPGLFRP